MQYVSDEDIDEFQGVIRQLPDDFSDDFREFAFYFIDQEGFEMPTGILGCLDLYLFLADKLWNTHKITVPERRINICVYFSVKNI